MTKHTPNKKYRSQYKLRYAIIAPLFKLLEAVLELLIPYFMIELIANFASVQTDYNHTAQLISNLITNYHLQLIVLATLLSAVFSISAQYMASRFAIDFSAALKEESYLHALALDSLQFQRLGSAFLNARLLNDAMAVQNGINLGLRLLLRSPFVIIGAIVMTYIISPLFGFILALAILLIAVIIFYLLRKSLLYYGKLQEQTQLLFQEINETKSGQASIRAFNAQSRIIDKFNQGNACLAIWQKRFAIFNAYVGPCSQVIINLALLLAFYLLSKNFILQVVLATELIAIYSYFSKSLLELIKLADLIINISKALGSYLRIQAFLKLEAKLKPNILATLEAENSRNNITASTGAQAAALKVAAASKLDLCVNNLTYTFPGNKAPTLAAVNLGCLSAPHNYGILGLTASGKTVLARVIAGLYESNGLQIVVDGKTRHFSSLTEQAAFLRANTAFVEQEAKLLKGTLRENFRYNNLSDAYLYSEAATQKIHAALQAAQAFDFVMAKGGIDCDVLEASANFSGGQRARLALAVALFKEAKIIILDDFLQALDLETALALMQTIKNLPFAAIVICLSQRVATLLEAEQIFILDECKILAQGTHSGLLETNELYRRLFHTQYPKEILD